MLGRKTITPPTPPMMPSITMERKKGSCSSFHNFPMKPLRNPKNSSIYPIKGSAQVKVNQKVTYMITRKMGSPR